jgi:hypothetical protein
MLGDVQDAEGEPVQNSVSLGRREQARPFDIPTPRG